MVQCDTCQGWSHFGCADVDASVRDRDWICVRCAEPPTGANSINSSAKSRSSRRSKWSSTRRKQIELLRLEEERKLQEQIDQEELVLKETRDKEKLEKKKKREQEFINKRIELELEHDESETPSEDENDKSNTDIVNHWLNGNNSQAEIQESNIPLSRHNITMQQFQQSTTKTEDIFCAAPATYDASLINYRGIDSSATNKLIFSGSGPGKLLFPTGPGEVGFIQHTNNGSGPDINRYTVSGPTHPSYYMDDQRLYYKSVPEKHRKPVPLTQLHNQQLRMPLMYPYEFSGDIGPTLDNHYPQKSNVHTRENNITASAIPKNLEPNLRHQTVRVERDSKSFNPNQDVEVQLANTKADDTSLQAVPISTQQMASRHVLSKTPLYFSGQPEDWPLFISSFERMSNACGLTTDEQLVKLQTALKGEAKESVHSLLMHPSNVPTIIETLRMLYGRPNLIIRTLLNKIRQQPGPKEGRMDTFVKFAVSVQNLCASMKAANLVAHLNNPDLVQELTDKLPIQFKLEWAKIYEAAYPDVTLITLSDWLSQMARTVSSVMFNIPTVVDAASKEIRGQKGKGFLNTHSSTPTNKDDNQKLSSISEYKSEAQKCRICSGPCHSPKMCKKFESYNLKERWSSVRANNLCWFCLRFHKGRRCRNRGVCGTNGCTRNHHKLLHNVEEDENTETKKLSVVTSPVTHATHQLQEGRQSVLLRIVPVVLYGRNTKLNTYAFLDEGSTLTLIDEEIADYLELKGTPEELCLKWTADMSRTEDRSRRVNLEISSSLKEDKRFQIRSARTVQSLDLPTQSVSIKNLSSKYPHLKGVNIESYDQVKPRILIGLDNGKLGLPRGYREGKDNEPIATKTLLGWVVHGASGESSNDKHTNAYHHFHICDCDKQLHQLVKDLYSTESLGGTKNMNTLESASEQHARHILETTTTRVNDRFETGLLWKSNQIRFPPSLLLATSRMECLERKMRKNPEVANNLRSLIRDYEEKGYIRQLNKEEIQNRSSITWYLPVFPVINSNKPGKVRLVWDAAATVDGISLNSALLKGPDQLNSLLFVLYRFRERHVAVTGDIKEMFHQVKIKKQDQDAQRFLWRDNEGDEVKHYTMQVMTFGATCSPSSAQYVLNKNASEFREVYPRAYMAIKENHYVDDFLDSLDSEEEAIELAKQVRMIHHRGGFEIRNWVSNSTTVIQALDQQVNLTRKNLNMSNEDGAEKILGICWCTESDSFSYSMSKKANVRQIIERQEPPTKREVLRTVMSVFDPLGLLAHYVIYIKILLQDVWRTAIDWDEKITSQHHDRWKKWIGLMPKLEQLKLPRCYLKSYTESQCDDIQLHIFVDASEDAYAAVAYFRFNKNNVVECALIGAKTRVAPLKPMTIPRLELEGAVLGVRLANSIAQGHSLKITSRHFWSDSKTVLCWLRSDHRRFKQFVAFRIGEILENSELEEWRWVPSKLNVADDATKWIKDPDLETNSRWFNGPEFISQPKEIWPIDKTALDTTDKEIRHVMVHTTTTKLIIAENFSSWKTLVRRVAFVIRAVNNMRAKSSKVSRLLGPLLQDELLQAEMKLFRQAQRDEYAKEVAILERNLDLLDTSKKLLDKSSIIYRNCPYLDKYRVMRTNGRIDTSDSVDDDVKRPILLPRKNHITYLVIRDYHEKYHHQNEETVINQIRQRFSIPQLRATSKNISKNCQKCKNRRATPKPPLMAELPQARLAAFTRPFTFTGVDYFGPINVSVGRRTEKRWGVLMTCLTSRAIHIEIAHSLSTDSCIMSLQNFMSRRGTPREIYSDNGTNFTGASRELQMNLRHPDVIDKFTTSSTKWIFIPPASPHMGGSWERLVRSVKRTLERITPNRNPSDELLRNMMAEIENIINSRPLTYVPIADENHEALTPNHLLIGSSDGTKPTGAFDDEGVLLRKNYMIARQYANAFWRRWVQEYLPTLTRRTKWCERTDPIKVGDIVVIIDENNHRNCWPKGRVVDVFPGKDGQVRHALVQTSTGIYKRPAVKLAVLDVGVHDKNGTSSPRTIYRGGVLTTASVADSSTD